MSDTSNLNKIRKSFGLAVKSQRELRNMSQQELADFVGTSSQVMISKIESGSVNITLATGVMLARVLGIRLDTLPVKLKLNFEQDDIEAIT